MMRRPPRSTLFPYPTLFRSRPPPRPDRLARPRDRPADDHAQGAEQTLEPRRSQVRTRRDPERRAPRALRRGEGGHGVRREHPGLHGGARRVPRRRAVARGAPALPRGEPRLSRRLRQAPPPRRCRGAARGDLPRLARLPRGRDPRRRPVRLFPREGAGGAERRAELRARRPGLRQAQLRLPPLDPGRGARPDARGARGAPLTADDLARARLRFAGYYLAARSRLEA